MIRQLNRFKPLTNPLSSMETSSPCTRFYWKNMDYKILQPPEDVCGMKELNREAFKKQVEVPCLRVPEACTNRILPILKDKLLKMNQLRPVRNFEAKTADDTSVNLKEILLHPACVTDWDSLPTEKLEENKIESNSFCHCTIDLNYTHWRADEIINSVLSKEIEGLTSYSRVGHIIHLNLREHLIPYKTLIAQVFADKLSGIRTVVNKAANIDNTYRNFEFELLYGEPDYQVIAKENGIAFEFDFSRVYWNPRLSTEHQRIVDMLKPNDVLYDVFAGVGPFSVPAAKKRCHVFANDLNPESFRWLKHNIERNKCTEYAELFNKDGREFIVEDVKKDLLKRWKGKNTDEESSSKIHVTMNLPALAVEFLDAFVGLFTPEELDSVDFNEDDAPLIHVYTFSKGTDTKALAVSMVEEKLGTSQGDRSKYAYKFVRNVAPNKDMYRISFHLTRELLTLPKKTQPQLKRKAEEVLEDEQEGKMIHR